MTKYLLLVMFTLFTMLLSAQNSEAIQQNEMSGLFYQEGKIYVVIAVVGIVFASILLFLLYLERKLNKLEKNTGKK